MSIDATAQALVTEEAVEAQVAETTEAPEQTEADELDAIWDKAQAPVEEAPEEVEPDEEAPEKAEEATEKAAEEKAPEKAKVEAPTDLPKAVSDVWGDIPEAARNAIADSQRKMARQLSDQGRLVQAITPIQQVLTDAAKDLPALANMTPQQVAKEVTDLAKISNDFNQKPVETMIGLIKRHKLEGAMQQALSGQAPTSDSMQSNALQNEIAQLKRQLQQVSDPDYLRSHVEQFTQQTQVSNEVTQFSQTAEHWGAVEAHMPNAIQFVISSQPDASPGDTLKRAYELAVSQFVPEASKAKQQAAAPEAVAVVDPERTEAAIKAKSVNVKSTTTGKPRALTEEQELSKVFDRMQS